MHLQGSRGAGEPRTTSDDVGSARHQRQSDFQDSNFPCHPTPPIACLASSLPLPSRPQATGPTIAALRSPCLLLRRDTSPCVFRPHGSCELAKVPAAHRNIQRLKEEDVAPVSVLKLNLHVQSCLMSKSERFLCTEQYILPVQQQIYSILHAHQLARSKSYQARVKV